MSKRTPEYVAWQNMRARCLNPKNPRYADYGGRGVTICERWNDYASFLADMGRRPGPGYSIDRADNDGSYSPENCRWATFPEQRRNTRKSRFLTFRGKTQCVADWAAEVGLGRDVILRRLQAGWPVEKVLTKPPGRWVAWP